MEGGVVFLELCTDERKEIVSVKEGFGAFGKILFMIGSRLLVNVRTSFIDFTKELLVPHFELIFS